MSRFVIVALLVAVAIAACNAELEDLTPVAGAECITQKEKIWVQFSKCGRWLCSQPEDTPCPLNVDPGCVCREGYLESDNGDCVLEKDCPKQ